MMPRAAQSRRSNPSIEDAARTAQSWQGRPAADVTEIYDMLKVRTNLADLAALEELFIVRDGYEFTANLKGRGVRLCAVPPPGSGHLVRQLIFSGGDQTVDPERFKLEAGPDKLVLGELQSIVYRARKSHLGDEDSPWEHEFGEEGGALPTVVYDALNKRIELVGGDYFIDLRDFDGETSRGIRN